MACVLRRERLRSVFCYFSMSLQSLPQSCPCSMGTFSRYLAASSSPLAAGAWCCGHGDGLVSWHASCTSALPWGSVCHSSCPYFVLLFLMALLLLPLPVFISLSSSGKPPDWEMKQNAANAPHLTGGKQRAQQPPVEQSSV